MSDSSDSSKPRPKTAAVPHYTVGEEIMNSVTHGVGCLLGIAGLVLLIVFAALRPREVKVIEHHLSLIHI